jgi:hypothetical protein
LMFFVKTEYSFRVKQARIGTCNHSFFSSISAKNFIENAPNRVEYYIFRDL